MSLEELWSALNQPEAFSDFVAEQGNAPTIRHLTYLLDLSRSDQVRLVKYSRGQQDSGSRPPDPIRTGVDTRKTQTEFADTLKHQLEEVARDLQCDLSSGLPSWVTQRRKPPSDPGTLTFVKRTAQVVAVVSSDGSAKSWPVRLYLRATVACPTNARALGELESPLKLLLGEDASREAIADTQLRLESLLEACRELTSDTAARARTELQQGLADGVLYEQIVQAGGLRFLLSRKTELELSRAEAERARALLGLEDYPQAFPVARSLQRTVRFRVGPTNSGKTHDALNALKAAKSGVYLAPLRLLAMEIRDRLVAEGVPCNLVTGEEKVMMANARHTACTVEMLDTETAVEVAVLDEIQMLQDQGRGWAWTYALVAAPARELFVCGDPSMLALCQRVVDSMRETHETQVLERKTTLTVEAKPLTNLKAIEEGDAVVAFSRKDVLTLSARLRQQGFKVATLYGALAPEVRRAEATRFSSGEAQVVVATDVIGMGLNLPIRRVVFSTAHKFDGEAVRPLGPSEVRQIAGRAGRFGKYPEGFVTALDATDLRIVRAALSAELPAPPKHLPLAPSRWHIEQLSSLLHSTGIGVLLEYFSTKVAVRSPLFKTASMEDSIALGHIVDATTPEMGLREKYSFACAPVTRDRLEELEFYEHCLRAHASGKEVRLPMLPRWVESNSPSHLEEAEALSKKLGLYAWLGFKFPETFVDHESVAARRSQVCRYIEKALLTQGGFGVTAKERFEQRRS